VNAIGHARLTIEWWTTRGEPEPERSVGSRCVEHGPQLALDQQVDRALEDAVDDTSLCLPDICRAAYRQNLARHGAC